MATFKVGDMVRLKSGGPLMTVTDAANQEGKDMVCTTYFLASGEEKNGYFPAEAVEADSTKRGMA
jgi:uncharacterized protein YodC (DUF2158 family)